MIQDISRVQTAENFKELYVQIKKGRLCPSDAGRKDGTQLTRLRGHKLNKFTIPTLLARLKNLKVVRNQKSINRRDYAVTWASINTIYRKDEDGFAHSPRWRPIAMSC